jgi:hypothetical protein
MTNTTGLPNARLNWQANTNPPNSDYQPYGFGILPPTFPAFQSKAKPSRSCGTCPHTLLCATMTISLHRCHKCCRFAIWVEELRKWVWPEKPACPHTQQPRRADDLCYDCKAKDEALQRLKEQNKRQPYVVTVTGSTVDLMPCGHGTTTGDSTFITGASDGTWSSDKVWSK